MATTSQGPSGRRQESIDQSTRRETGDRRRRLDALRAHLAEGAGQAARKDFVEGFDIETIIERAKSRA